MSGLPTLPSEIMRRNEEGAYELATPLDEICAKSTVSAPDGVSLLVAGAPRKTPTGCQGAGRTWPCAA